MNLLLTLVALAAAPAPGVVREAEISLLEGVHGEPNPTVITLRNATVTLLAPRTDKGETAGMHQAPLAAGDPIWGLLDRLPAKLPEPARGAPGVHMEVKTRAGKRALNVGRPVTDPAVKAFLARLDQLQAAARTHPVATLSLKLAQRTQGVFVIQARATGIPGAEVAFDARDLQLQLLDITANQGSGIRQPPRWTQGATLEAAPVRLKAGEQKELAVPGKIERERPHLVHAFLGGPLILRVPGRPESTIAAEVSSDGGLLKSTPRK